MTEDPLKPHRQELAPLVAEIVSIRKRQEDAKKVLDEERGPLLKRIHLIEEHASALRDNLAGDRAKDKAILARISILEENAAALSKQLSKEFSEAVSTEKEARHKVEETLLKKKTIECEAYRDVFSTKIPESPQEAYYYLQALAMGKLPKEAFHFDLFGFEESFLFGLLPIKKYSKVGNIKVLGVKAMDTERRVGSYFIWFGYLACTDDEVVGFMGFKNSGNRIKHMQYWAGNKSKVISIGGDHVSKPLRQFKNALKEALPYVDR